MTRGLPSTETPGCGICCWVIHETESWGLHSVPGCRALDNRPSVIIFGIQQIEFVPQFIAMLRLPQRAILGMKEESLRISMPVGEIFRSGAFRSDKGIIIGYRSIRVEAQYLTDEIVEVLSERWLVDVTGCQIQFSIRTKAKTAATVIHVAGYVRDNPGRIPELVTLQAEAVHFEPKVFPRIL